MWWVASFGAHVDVFSSPNATAARARHPTWTLAGPFGSQSAAQTFARGGSPVASTPRPAAPVGGCGPQAIYQALLGAGFSTVQAIGAMANAIHESSLSPEARARDTNGAFSNGLWQFNEASFPDSGKLVTGNCAHDLAQQVGYLKSHISGGALAGSTGAQVASNFAANFERCQGCQPGGSQNAARTASAATVEGWISSGHWPTSSGGGASGGGGGGSSGGGGGSGGGGSGGGGGGSGNVLTSTIAPGTCVLPLNIPIAGQFCVLSKGQARGIIGALLIIGGGLLVLPGLLVLAAAGLERTGAGAAASKALSATPAGRVAGAAGRGGRASGAYLSGVGESA